MSLLDLIFPKRCLGCGRIGKYFCDRCSSIIRIIEPNESICPVCERLAIDGATHPVCKTRYALDGLTSFFHYKGVVREAIKSLKYRYVSDLADEFISLIPSFSLSRLTNLPTNQATVIVPIPLHPSRQKFRGFNQAELLGRILSQKIGISLKTNILKRVKKTTPQVEMKKRDARLKNMENVFSVNQLPINNSQLSIFLFDDVFTTGATLRSAAAVLKRAGVKYVWAITMAR